MLKDPLAAGTLGKTDHPRDGGAFKIRGLKRLGKKEKILLNKMINHAPGFGLLRFLPP